MTAKTPEEIQGFEYDWLACDDSGQVALLSTAGGGYAPGAFLADTDAYDQALDVILALPATTSAEAAPQVAEGLENTWRQAAERGLYAFDSDTFGGPYRAVGVPRSPIRIEDLPVDVAAIVARVRFSQIRFDLVEQILREDIVKSEACPD